MSSSPFSVAILVFEPLAYSVAQPLGLSAAKGHPRPELDVPIDTSAVLSSVCLASQPLATIKDALVPWLSLNMLCVPAILPLPDSVPYS